MSYVPKLGASWYWKRICLVKEELKKYYSEAELSIMVKYSIQRVYDKIKGVKGNMG